MIIRLQYTDESFWEGPPEEFHNSPDPRPPDGGIVWMWGITDDGRTTSFAYDDYYYLYCLNGDWVLGSGTPSRDFAFKPNRTIPVEIDPLDHLPEGAIIRYGCTVSDEVAEKLGLRFEFKTAKTGPEEDCGCGKN